MLDKFVYLETKPNGNSYRNRGLLPIDEKGGDTFSSFSKKMATSNLRTFLSDTNLGREVRRIVVGGIGEAGDVDYNPGEIETTVVEV